MTRSRLSPSWLLICAMWVVALWPVIGFVLFSTLVAWLFREPTLMAGVIPVLFLVFYRRASPTLQVDAQSQPDLIKLVESLARRSGWEKPPTVQLGAMPVAQMGWQRDRRTKGWIMQLGAPLVVNLSEAELSAVIAHELAHREDLATIRQRSFVRARQSLATGRGFPVATNVLLDLTRASLRDSEFVADEAAVGVVGVQSATAALVGSRHNLIFVLDILRDTMDRLSEQREHPVDLFECWRLALTDPVVIELFNVARRNAASADQQSARDYHPSDYLRIARLVGCRADRVQDHQAVDSRLADLPVALADIEHIEKWVTAQLLGERPRSKWRPVRLQDMAVVWERDDLDFAQDQLLSAAGGSDVRQALLWFADRVDDREWVDFADGESDRDILRSAAVISSVLVGPLTAAGWQRSNRWIADALVSPDGQSATIRVVVYHCIADANSADLRRLINAADFTSDSQ